MTARECIINYCEREGYVKDPTCSESSLGFVKKITDDSTLYIALSAEEVEVTFRVKVHGMIGKKTLIRPISAFYECAWAFQLGEMAENAIRSVFGAITKLF